MGKQRIHNAREKEKENTIQEKKKKETQNAKKQKKFTIQGKEHTMQNKVNTQCKQKRKYNVSEKVSPKINKKSLIQLQTYKSNVIIINATE